MSSFARAVGCHKQPVIIRNEALAWRFMLQGARQGQHTTGARRCPETLAAPKAVPQTQNKVAAKLSHVEPPTLLIAHTSCTPRSARAPTPSSILVCLKRGLGGSTGRSVDAAGCMPQQRGRECASPAHVLPEAHTQGPGPCARRDTPVPAPPPPRTWALKNNAPFAYYVASRTAVNLKSLTS